MEPSGLYSVRVKKEPCDESFNEIDYKVIIETPAAGHVQSLRFPRENSIQALRKCDENQENELDELRIELECRDQKPILNLPTVKKMEDHSQNHLQGINYSYDYHTLNTIKVETAGVVKKESFDEDPTNGLGEPNQKRRVEKKLIYERGRKKHIDSTHDRITHTCDTCGKTYAHKNTLKLHIDSVHNKITHACEVCKKIFTRKDCLRTHIDTIHNGLKEYKCDLCEKQYSHKGNLQKHIDSVHNKITHACDICKKIFTRKSYLQIHVNAIHNGVKHTCEICGKNFLRKDGLRNHFYDIHNGVTYRCDFCEKRYCKQSSFYKHVKSSHNGIKHACKLCGKIFGRKINLDAHLGVAHRSQTTTE